MSAIFLSGFMGCGKSSAGAALAKRLGLGFVDTDEYIVKKEGMSIPEIFKDFGEEFFREKESEAIAGLSGSDGVFACGGGALLRASNFEAIKSHGGTAVYIELDFETCYGRISGDNNRPLVIENTKERLKEIYCERIPLYARHCSFSSSGAGSPEDVADDIIRRLGVG